MVVVLGAGNSKIQGSYYFCSQMLESTYWVFQQIAANLEGDGLSRSPVQFS